MKLTVERPHVVLACRDGGRWVLPSAEWDSVREALKKGAAWYECRDCWGDLVLIKLVDVVGASDRRAEGFAIEEEEREERRQRALRDGGE